MINGIKNFLIESHNVYVSYGYIKTKINFDEGTLQKLWPLCVRYITYMVKAYNIYA